MLCYEKTFFDKFPEIFRGKSPEISELTNLIPTIRLTQWHHPASDGVTPIFSWKN